MVRSCCVVGCTNRREGKNKNLSFYRMPKGRTPIEKRRRNDWVRAIRREDWKTWSYERISKASICAEHFVSGKRGDKPEEPNWIPTIFRNTTARGKHKMTKKRRYEKRKSNREQEQEIWNVQDKNTEREVILCHVDNKQVQPMRDAIIQCDLPDTEGEIVYLRDIRTLTRASGAKY